MSENNFKLPVDARIKFLDTDDLPLVAKESVETFSMPMSSGKSGKLVKALVIESDGTKRASNVFLSQNTLDKINALIENSD